MSAGVSDQRMKGQGTQAKNVEERSIPWSQQVDEASYENLSSPTEGNQSGSSGGGTQFQYPPFNAKDGAPPPLQQPHQQQQQQQGFQSGGNNRRNNYQNDGYGSQSSYNNYPRNGGNEYNNSWNSKHQINSNNQNYNNRRSNHYDENNYRSERNNHHGNDGGYKQSLQRGVQNLSVDNNDSRSSTSHNKNNSIYNDNNAAGGGGGGVQGATTGGNNSGGNDHKTTTDTNQQATVSKAMTWASIASQPAKPTLRTNSTSSALKKKGPGMPPPPMVPGKHNMDIGTWDTPAKNGPPLVPPPLPPVIPVPIMEQSPLAQTNKSSNNGGQQQKQQQQQQQRGNNDENIRNPSNIANSTAQHQKQFDRNNHHYQNQSTKGADMKPPWVAQQQHLHHHHQQQQQQQQQQPHPQPQHHHPQHHQQPYHPPHHHNQHHQQQQLPLLPHHQQIQQQQHHHQKNPINSRNINTNSYLRTNTNFGRQDSQESSGNGRPSGSYHHQQQQQHHNNQSHTPQQHQLQHPPPPIHQPIGVAIIPETVANVPSAIVIQQQQQHQPPQQQHINYPPVAVSPSPSNTSSNPAVLDELRDRNNYNPHEFDIDKASLARFFVIKSYAEDDIHRSIKYEIWCSTDHGNKRLDSAFQEREHENGHVYLLFSVNSSRHFCGMAQMMTRVDYNSNSKVWAQDKWKGSFRVKWIYVKDVPNEELRHIRIETNENKPITNSRDTQEVPNDKGIEALRVIHQYQHITSIFDDFFHYDKLQEKEEVSKKYEPPQPSRAPIQQDRYDSSVGNNMIISERERGPGGGGGGNGIPGGGQNRSYRQTSGAGGDYDRGGGSSSGSYEKTGYHHQSSGYRERNNYGRGGYHNYDRRNNSEDYNSRGASFDRNYQRANDTKEISGSGGSGNESGGPSSGHYNNNRESSNGGDYHNNRGGYHRGDYSRNENRGFSGYNNRDRSERSESYHEGGGSTANNHAPASGGFMNRADNRPSGSGGSFRENYNRKGNWRRSTTQQSFEGDNTVEN